MQELIEHLNSINREQLLLLEGMSTELLERLLSSRPFSSREEILEVEGVTPDLLSAWENNLHPERKTKNDSSEPAVKKGRGVGRVILRVLTALLILAALAAEAYYGIPYFREKILKPLESNTSRVGELAATQAADTSRFEADLGALQEEFTNLQGQVSALQTQAAAASKSIDSHSASLNELSEVQATLRAEMAQQNNALLANMDEQLTLTRALELLSRSRLYLSQNNYGMARADVLAARNLLLPLVGSVSAQKADGLRVVIDRLDMALGNLPAYPVIAVFDVDTAWQMLVDGLPSIPEPAVTPMLITPTPQPTTLPESTTPVPLQTQPVAPSATP
ncbi:MAG TPA: hypothetical protein PKZ26_06875 [Anaerolineaceae bacterium]|nr:hypothetical protein [Anaerolineaceae bacterium]